MIAGGEREEVLLPFALRAVARAEVLLSRLEACLRRARKRARGETMSALVILEWRLGDEIMALPVLEALARTAGPMALAVRLRHPDLVRGNPFVASVNPLAARPDLEIDVRGEVALEPRRTTLARRAGVSLTGILPRVYLEEDELRVPPHEALVRLPRPWVVVHAGATQPCKSWGSASWRAVARTLAAEGASVVEVGQEGTSLGVGVSLLGRTSVRELARTLAQADLVLGDDSGPLHLALAVGSRAVGVFGSTDPTLLYPAGAGLVPLVTDAACRFCWPRRTLAYPGGSCPLERHECMDAVTVDAVLRAARAALAEPVGAAR